MPGKRLSTARKAPRQPSRGARSVHAVPDEKTPMLAAQTLMTRTSPTLRQYELIASLSEKMVQLARLHDWESVASVGQEYVDAVEHLKGLKPLEGEDRMARKPYLTKILNDDARIRHMVAPELERLGALLGTMKRQQSVADTYLAPPKIRS